MKANQQSCDGELGMDLDVVVVDVVVMVVVVVAGVEETTAG